MAGAGVFPKVTGDTIYLLDYNSLQSTIASVKTTYYGVACSSSQLTGTPEISRIEWNNLKTDINSCIKHQSGSNTAITDKSTGETVTFGDINAYYTQTASADTNKASVFASSQLSLVNPSGGASTNGGGWNTSVNHIVTVTWASSAEATYFFNCGGSVTWQASYSGGSDGPLTKDKAWKNLIDSVGMLQYTRADYLAGGTKTYGPYFSGVYTANNLTVTVVKNSDTQLTITIVLSDASGQPNAPWGTDETVGTSITSSVGYYKSIDAIVSPFPNAVTTTNSL
jgi:hypothetical protein